MRRFLGLGLGALMGAMGLLAAPLAGQAVINNTLAELLQHTIVTTDGAFTMTGVWNFTSTVTSNVPLLDVRQTWQNASTAFTAAKINVTDNASTAASLILDTQVAGTSKFHVRKDGRVFVGGMEVFAGTSSSFPGLRRTATVLDVRLADDSAYSGVTVSALNFGIGASTAAGSITPTADGVVELLNAAGTNFNRLLFGGTTASFPSLKRTGTGIDVRLADDSAYGLLTASAVAFTNASVILESSNGVLSLRDAAQTSFNRLQFGGTTNSFPALKRNSTALEAKLADDSTYTTINAGAFLVPISAGSVGFSTGAGGAVTQLTNKTTGVALNKPTGQITTNNASLNAATTAAFTVTNSAVTTTDVIVVLPWAGTSGAYQAWASDVGSGTFVLNLRNMTAGALGEAVVINFVVLKGASS